MPLKHFTSDQALALLRTQIQDALAPTGRTGTLGGGCAGGAHVRTAGTVENA